MVTLVLASLSGCASTEQSCEQGLFSVDPNVYLFEGQGATIDEANRAARSGLAQQILSQDSSSDLQWTSTSSQSVEHSSFSTSRSVAQVELERARVIEQRQCGGNYYVAVELDMRPLVVRAREALAAAGIPGQPSGFYGSPLLTRSVGSQFPPGHGPRLELRLQWDHGWLLQVGPASVPLRRSELVSAFEQLSGATELGLSTQRIGHGDMLEMTLSELSAFPLDLLIIHFDGSWERIGLPASFGQSRSLRLQVQNPTERATQQHWVLAPTASLELLQRASDEHQLATWINGLTEREVQTLSSQRLEILPYNNLSR
ncbi:hypothetical protein [Ferrimonas pelagia]|uniref:Lipoprotein n=1 Tax=Ferrimonas pelagia TaxID=1177826 RepID=A0ABP9EC12_9GAMM